SNFSPLKMWLATQSASAVMPQCSRNCVTLSNMPALPVRHYPLEGVILAFPRRVPRRPTKPAPMKKPPRPSRRGGCEERNEPAKRRTFNSQEDDAPTPQRVVDKNQGDAHLASRPTGRQGACWTVRCCSLSHSHGRVSPCIRPWANHTGVMSVEGADDVLPDSSNAIRD